MSHRTDIAYTYDGTFQGFLCCVFASYYRKELPYDIQPCDNEQDMLLQGCWIETDPEQADRVYSAIGNKICAEAQELVWMGWFTNAPHKELLLLRFVRLGFAHGSKIMLMLAEDSVCALNKAVQHLKRESHRYMGFIRFSAYGEALVAVIEPQNQVLPLIQEHFCQRFSNEQFLIHDQTHKMALIHQPRQSLATAATASSTTSPVASPAISSSESSAIIHLEHLTLPEMNADEAMYRQLWKQFYQSIAIKERINPKLRMSHMPKRYWNRMTEMQPEQ